MAGKWFINVSATSKHHLLGCLCVHKRAGEPKSETAREWVQGREHLGMQSLATATHCSVLQCVAVCCSVLQCVAVCCNVLQCVAVRCSGKRLHTNDDVASERTSS